MNELTSPIRQMVVLDIANLAREKYIFPEKGAETARAIQAYLEAGRYEAILDPDEFARQLTTDLREISHDHHWAVSYNSALTRAVYAEGETESDLDQLKEHLYRSNFGVEKFEHLSGNIGYVDVRGFSWIGFPGAGETIVALMQLVSHCDALIFDMRQNHGGEVETLQLYISYFVQPEPILYDSFYYRVTNKIQQFWTMPYVPGNRMPDIPLFILTSKTTGSGGEAFAYLLQSMGRGVVVGETTLGAAHTTDMEIVQEQFQVEYPSGRSINPFTHSDWEGSGVIPDIAVPGEAALKVAHLQALGRLIQACPDERRKQNLEKDLDSARTSYNLSGADQTTSIPRESFSTPRLVIRPFRPEDADDLYAYLSDERVYQFEPGAPLDREQAQKQAVAFSSSPEFWAVELRAEHKVIGQIYFSPIEPHHQMTWELGYILSPAYQRQGYASEAVAALVRHDFSTYPHRVVAHCNPENIASWKLLEKVGFRREGLLKKANYFHKDANGEPIWTDTLIYALLADEVPRTES